MDYAKPGISDYGDLIDLTAATATFGEEDAGNKLTTAFHHSAAA